MQFINVGLMKNPLNWVIVFLMLAIAGIAGHYALTFWQSSAATVA